MKSKACLFFLLPVLILIIVFVVYPILGTIGLSFLSPEGKFVGFQNYVNVLTSDETINLKRFPFKHPPWGTLIHNAVWITIHLPLSLVLGLFFAVVLKGVKGSSVIKSLIFLGMVTPMVVGGWLVRFMFDKNLGIVNLFLRLAGLTYLADKTWTMWPQLALLATILGAVWMWTGFSMVIYSAALATIPKEYYEAADIDGASTFQKFFYITLPLLKPATIVIVVMSILEELKIFDLVFVATMGGPGSASNVLALQMYLKAFKYFEANEAAAIAVILALLTIFPALYVVKSMVGKQ